MTDTRRRRAEPAPVAPPMTAAERSAEHSVLLSLEAVASYVDMPEGEMRAAGVPIGSTTDGRPYSTRQAVDRWIKDGRPKPKVPHVG